ncbi:MAG TPA: DUF5103 domain-containing protein [Bacteroidales bacterium]|nr:DUF5103 domain-containing protein [Bacteroidales bacterium]
MKKILSFTLLLLSCFKLISQNDYYTENYVRNQDFVYNESIKTVMLYKLGFELSAPVIALHSDEKLVLTFDDLSADYVKYEYTIIHCDADWNVSDLMPGDYLESFTDDYIDDFAYSVNTMQSYVNYRKIIPNDVISFKLSGNYLLKVYTENNPDQLILTRRFFVVEDKATVTGEVRMSSNVNERNWRQEVNCMVNTTGLTIIDPYQEIKLTIRQNGRWDNSITGIKPYQIRNNELFFNEIGSNVFDGGNGFRYFDIKTLRSNTMRVKMVDYDPVNGYQVYLHDDEIKKKHVYVDIQENINGRYLIKTEDMPDARIQSEYATVNFFLSYPTPLIEGKLYVTGGLTNWQLLREAEMKYNPARKGFEANLLLKQGFYNYQYVLLPNNKKVADLWFAEGNFYETNNEYTIYVYYRPQGSRYDQLVNVTMILAH